MSYTFFDCGTAVDFFGACVVIVLAVVEEDEEEEEEEEEEEVSFWCNCTSFLISAASASREASSSSASAVTSPGLSPISVRCSCSFISSKRSLVSIMCALFVVFEWSWWSCDTMWLSISIFLEILSAGLWVTGLLMAC